MDITRQSLLNPLEIKIDDGASIFVDHISMAHHSKLFYNLKIVKDDEGKPKMRGSLDHWKLIHRHCVNRTWERVLVKEISNLPEFFTLLEFLQIKCEVVDLLLRDAIDQNLITDEIISKFPNGIVEDCKTMKRMKLVVSDNSLQLKYWLDSGHYDIYNIICDIDIKKCKDDPLYINLIGREIKRRIKRLKTDK